MTNNKPITIVLCDDHASFRKGVRQALEKREGIEIIGEAENGQVLLDLLETLRPDLIFLDTYMPVLDALDTLPILKTRYPQIKVIILTVMSDPAFICKMIGMGATCYLTTDADSQELYDTVIACKDKWLHVNGRVRNAILEHYQGPEGEIYLSGYRLNKNEVNVLSLLTAGNDIEKIAEMIHYSPHMVRVFIDRLKSKTKTESDAELIEICEQQNLFK